MLCLFLVTSLPAQIELWPLLGFVGVVITIILNAVSVRQSIKRAKIEHDEKFATKELLDEKIKVVDIQITLMDKEICADRATNLREHDSIKKDIDSKLDSISKTVNQLFDLVTRKLK